MKKYNFRPEKSYGQNFIVDDSICPRMSYGCSDSTDSGIIEIGPGIGVLTCELAKRYKKVVSIELDKKLLNVLDDTLSEFDNISIINEDVMKVNLKHLIENEFKEHEVSVCANLPYYITSPIIMKLLEEELPVRYITVMIQKEAANRICSEPGQRECGAVSLSVRYYSDPEILFDVPRSSFFPSPEVDSSVIRLKVNKDRKKSINDKRTFFNTIKYGFSQRRKTLINSLSKGFKIPKSCIDEIFSKLDIPICARAEQISFEDFARISNAVSRL